MGAIKLMGIELEGAWRGEKFKAPFQDTPIKHDGSVSFSQDGKGHLHYGELVSPPMTPDELCKWTLEHCPTDTNPSCGTHIHVSLQSAPMYGALLTPTFARELIHALWDANETIKDSDPVTYQTFLKRLEGSNRYCRRGYKGMQQIALDSKGSERYQQLNYCYKLHGTLEIRVFPGTTNKEFLVKLIRVTEALIEEWVKKEHRVEKVRFRRG